MKILPKSKRLSPLAKTRKQIPTTNTNILNNISIHSEKQNAQKIQIRKIIEDFELDHELGTV